MHFRKGSGVYFSDLSESCLFSSNLWLNHCNLDKLTHAVSCFDSGQRVKPRIAYFVHGADGLGETYKAEPKGQKSLKSAADFLVEKVAEFPGEVTVVALGPLTNIALVSDCFFYTHLFSVARQFM